MIMSHSSPCEVFADRHINKSLRLNLELKLITHFFLKGFLLFVTESLTNQTRQQQRL